jgi:hypothetical protein
MITLGRREKCVRNRVEKEAFPDVACPPDAKPAPSAAAETPWTNPGLNLAEVAVWSTSGIGIGESQWKSRPKIT